MPGLPRLGGRLARQISRQLGDVPGNAPHLVHRQHIGDVADRASFYYFFMVFVVIRYKTKATARRALTFIVRVFVNDTIAIAVWTRFHAIAVWRSLHVCLCT